MTEAESKDVLIRAEAVTIMFNAACFNNISKVKRCQLKLMNSKHHVFWIKSYKTQIN